MQPHAQLKKWRGGRSYREAGEVLGCDASFVRYIEKKTRRPGRDLAIRLRDEAGIPVEAWPKSKKKSRHRKTASKRSVEVIDKPAAEVAA